MNLYEFSNVDLRELSSFQVATPDGWDLVPNDEALLTVVTDPDAGGFKPNVVVSADRFIAGIELADLDRGIETGMRRDQPDAAIGAATPGTIDGEPALMRSLVQLTRPDGPFMFQLQVLVFAPSTPGGDRFLFQIHASCDATETETWGRTLVDIVRSLRFLRDHEGAVVATALSAA